MAELIDKSALMKALENYCGNQPYLVSQNILNIIDNQPTITEEELRAKAIDECINEFVDWYGHGYSSTGYYRLLKQLKESE